MQLISEEGIKVTGPVLNIEDSLSSNNVSLKIEAAHAGIMNGNYLFYLPKALQVGAESLNKFYKPLQKKHYSKTLGYIYESSYVPTKVDSKYYNKIVNYSNAKELVDSVKHYIKTPEYQENKTGFGVLVSKAKLHDQNKIMNLKCNDVGTVSVAGDAGVAYCSICTKHVAECNHKLGQRYKNELCFGIVADDFEVDHISFETIPANWETNSLIITDSNILGNIELIEEGQLMKLSLDQFKEKLGNIESVLAELNLSEYYEQYNTEVESTLKSKFLLAADQLLPFGTPLTIFVTNALLDQLEDSDDKQILANLFGTAYTDIFEGKTPEEVTELLLQKEVTTVELTPVEEDETIVVDLQPEVTEVAPQEALQITDANAIALAITDSLTATFENTFQSFMEEVKGMLSKEQEVKANKLLEDQLLAYKEDLESSSNMKNIITQQLKESLINQIILLKNVSRDSEYVTKLQKRSIQELNMTLEDHVQLSTTAPVVEPVTPTLSVTDSNNHIAPTDVTIASSSMDNPIDSELSLQIEDADQVLESILSGVDTVLNKQEFTQLYKQTVLDHGSKVAKKLHSALKAKNKI